jgi:hypothetical protein
VSCAACVTHENTQPGQPEVAVLHLKYVDSMPARIHKCVNFFMPNIKYMHPRAALARAFLQYNRHYVGCGSNNTVDRHIRPKRSMGHDHAQHNWLSSAGLRPVFLHEPATDREFHSRSLVPIYVVNRLNFTFISILRQRHVEPMHRHTVHVH